MKNISRVILIVLINVGLNTTLFSQTADSIYQLVQSISTPNEKIDSSLSGAQKLLFLNKDTAMLMAQEALQLAKKIEAPFQIARAENMIGEVFFFRDLYDSALDWKHKARERLQSIDSLEWEAILLGSIGHINTYKGDYNQSLLYINKAINIFQEIGNEVRYAQTNVILGYALRLLKEYGDAENAYKEALEVFRKDSINNVTAYYQTVYYLGEVYVESERAEEAIPLLVDYTTYNKSLKENINVYMDFVSEATLGTALVKSERYNDGIQLCSEALKVSKPLEELAGSVDCHLCIAEGLLQKNDLDSAESNALSAYIIADSINSIERKTKSSLLLSQVYEKKGDYEVSLKYLKNFQLLNDSLFSKTKSQQFARLRAESEIASQERENRLLQARLENADLRAALLAGSIIVILTLLIIFYRNYRSKLSYSKELEEKVNERTFELNDSNQNLTNANEQLHRLNIDLQQLNMELQQFAYVTSHDLKQPIKNILGFSDMIQRKLENKDELGITNYVQYIAKGAKRMGSLVEAVTNYTTVNKSGNQSKIDLNEVLDEVTDILHNQIQEKDARVQYGGLPTIFGIEDNIILVFKNLVENGIKYNDSEPPLVKIGYEELANFHRFTVTDNGIGVDKKYEEYIFELFRRLHPKTSEGTGLGLAITKKIIHGMGGTIGLESNNSDEGSIFYFTLPK